MNRSRVILVACAGLILAAGLIAAHRAAKRPPGQRAAWGGGGERAPDGARVRVQVLNGTEVRGLARRATMVLRDRGFDVVETGTVSSTLDTTVVLDLSGHPDWARRVARALAPARVETRTDSSRYLDIAVVLGSTWRPPSEPFYP